MQFPEFNPVWFSIGPLDIRWYALAYVAGIVLGWWYAARIIKTERLWAPGKAPINTQQLDDLVLWVTLGIILGGRLGFALFYQPHLYGQLFGGPDNFALFRLWDGGMSFHGGLIGCTVAVVVFALRSKVRVLTVGDIALAAAPFGLMFGRLANFINGELWGRETTVPWAVRFCNGLIERTYGFCPAGNEPRHPSQLYEAGLEGIFLMGILAFAIWKVGLLRKPGYVTGLFLLGYGVIRASLENVRQPDVGLDHLPFGLTMGMILSTPMMLIGAWLIWRAWSRPPVTAA
ncbi:MAG: prolipoprotein diacylglyceryl transferase [Brevundimonas sp.]|nr:MAG: prolipoprotein diacylglyceryl transferase [Brevundimonas sp.]